MQLVLRKSSWSDGENDISAALNRNVYLLYKVTEAHIDWYVS